MDTSYEWQSLRQYGDAWWRESDLSPACRLPTGDQGYGEPPAIPLLQRGPPTTLYPVGRVYARGSAQHRRVDYLYTKAALWEPCEWQQDYGTPVAAGQIKRGMTIYGVLGTPNGGWTVFCDGDSDNPTGASHNGHMLPVQPLRWQQGPPIP